MRTYYINRELNDSNYYMSDIINFKQGDSDNTLVVSIMDRGAPADLTGITCTAVFALPDGTTSEVAGTVSGNDISITLDANLLSQVGYVTLEIKLVKGTASTTTFAIKYRVVSSIDTSGSTGTGGNSTIIVDGSQTSQNTKYAILVVAGQSNAVGFDESPVSTIFDAQAHPRIKQLGYYDDDNLKIIPLSHCAESFQDMRAYYNTSSPDFKGTKGIHLPLAKRILNHIPEDYDLLVISAAYGGTGFTTNTESGYGTYDETNKKPQQTNVAYRWGVESAYYKAMKDRIQYVLDLNENNYCIGVVWCQGENDYANPTEHYTAFQAMTNDFFVHFNNGYKDRVKAGTWDKNIWYTFETTYYWKTTSPYNTGINQIWANYQTWSSDTYVAITSTATDTNEANGNGKTTQYLASHYGNGAYEKLVAPLVYERMLVNNIF